MQYYYSGRSSNPFAFIVNSGERKDYHLFYIRHPKPGHREQAERVFGPEAVNTNSAGEVTIQIRNRQDAEKVFELMSNLHAGRPHKICPLCGHQFQGNGWDGIDAHWRAHHEDACSYEVAWRIISAIESNHASSPLSPEN